MIPKIIHYCWFGRGEKPELAKKCIASWKKFCPDFEIREWNEDNCDYLAGAVRWRVFRHRRGGAAEHFAAAG